jgi:hypothetical protein
MPVTYNILRCLLLDDGRRALLACGQEASNSEYRRLGSYVFHWIVQLDGTAKYRLVGPINVFVTDIARSSNGKHIGFLYYDSGCAFALMGIPSDKP